MSYNPYGDTSPTEVFLGLFAFLVVIGFVIFVGITGYDTGYAKGEQHQVRQSTKRAKELDEVWYDKKGNLVYSGNLAFIITGSEE